MKDKKELNISSNKTTYNVTSTPLFDELINKIKELTQLLDSFHKTPDLFVTYTKSIIGNE